ERNDKRSSIASRSSCLLATSLAERDGRALLSAGVATFRGAYFGLSACPRPKTSAEPAKKRTHCDGSCPSSERNVARIPKLTAPPPQDGVSTSSTTWARAREGACSKAPGTVQASYLRFGFGCAGEGAAFVPSVFAGCCAGGEAVCFSGPDPWLPGTGTAAPPV